MAVKGILGWRYLLFMVILFVISFMLSGNKRKAAELFLNSLLIYFGIFGEKLKPY